MATADQGTAQRAAETAARLSYGKLVAFLAARTRDVAGAEDALSEAFAAALVDWPARSVPDKPEAWLLTVARRKMIDAGRQQRASAASAGHLQLLVELADDPSDRPELPDAGPIRPAQRRAGAT